jgi:hypothetical protein
MPKQGTIHLAKDLESYFGEQLTEVAKKQGVKMSPLTHMYLASLLDRFSKTSAFLLQNMEDHRDSETAEQSAFPRLAPIWLESFSKTIGEQFIRMQSLGDFALFTRGFFSERVKKSGAADLDYYSAIGESAYARAGQISESLRVERDVNAFFELAEGFNGFVEVFSELSDQTLLGSDKDVLKLYEKWHSTRSQRIFRMLAENGIIAASNDPSGPNRSGLD